MLLVENVIERKANWKEINDFQNGLQFEKELQNYKGVIVSKIKVKIV